MIGTVLVKSLSKPIEPIAVADLGHKKTASKKADCRYWYRTNYFLSTRVPAVIDPVGQTSLHS